MSRSRPRSGPSVSLFPFLAVLLCTMGALLVLLVFFSRSRQHADTAAVRAEAQRHEDELRLARDELAWRLDHLAAIRDQTTADLARGRMQLAGVEDDSRALADELDSLERTAAVLVGETAETADEVSVEELERRLADAVRRLDEAQDEAAARPAAYAVVPYAGSHGTHRRPLYIECCIDGVFLQPEGIRLGPADFEGPPGPGNPLASALRAAREHIARTPGESGDPAAQPYPLLLVRPTGVMAYYAAREAIQSWGSEFGYQFIDEEWTLAYPPVDPALREAELRAVEESRRRLEWLARVRPARPTRPTTQYRAATTRGGVVSNSGPSVLGDQSRWTWTEEQAGLAARGRTGSWAAGESADGSGHDDPGGASQGADPGTEGGDPILGAAGSRPGPGRAAGSAANPPGGDGGGGAGGPASGVEAGAGGPFAATNRFAGPSRFYAAAGGDASTGAGGRPGSPSAAPGGNPGTAAGGDGSNAGPNESAGYGPEGDSGEGSAGSGSSGTPGATRTASTGGGGTGPSMPGLAQAGGSGVQAAAGGSAAASLAGARGSNWASLATHDRPIPLTRPIRLECAAAEFRILSENGRVESRIPIGDRTADSVDRLISEVHQIVRGWGLAGERMYWKPELILSATPDGTARREDLERLLADSGVDTRRSGTRDKVRELPPVERTGGFFRSR